MDVHYYEVWENTDNPICYTIVRDDGMAWISGNENANKISTPSFIGPLGNRENHLGEKLADTHWPPNIITWLDERSLLE